ncbi:MAG: tetratricopeptide repeat protein, partial [Nitrospirota bacterium]
MSLATQKIIADTLFSETSVQASSYSSLAQVALTNGANLSLKGDYINAAKQFQRAISLDPSKDNAVNAYKLMATAYMQAKMPENAIKAYKASLKVDLTNDETHVALGNIYYGQGKYSAAVAQYEAAVKISSPSSVNRYSLGQGYMAQGRYQEAAEQFEEVIRLAPAEHSGYYALGQVYSKEGNNEKAIAQFLKAIDLNPNFYAASVDLGSSYADMGQTSDALQQVSYLLNFAPSMASTLNTYITSVTKPKFLAAYTTGGFTVGFGPGTPVSSLDPYLATPDTTKVFTMTFVFNKAMDHSSVVNPLNWSISKAPLGASFGAYDWGMTPPDTDVPIAPIPVGVLYDTETLTATISFVISQNADATGT